MSTSQHKKCLACGNGFEPKGRAAYCSAACRQRGYRSRAGGDRHGVRHVRNADDRSEQATAVLQALDAELALSAKRRGVPLHWSAAERTVMAMMADAIDRKVELQHRWQSADDDAARVKLSGEVRLLEQEVARLLKQVTPDVPAPSSLKSTKARDAVNVRWRQHAD
ncbi:hypothetical protein [Mycolicibacterium sp. 120270]|uniref:hypothetical protein n=1 Tax=Mycolicibacterium sp. 120270 TaxID=3090600 RepID=UPI00299CF9E2|nr:hypothetical protein [Mycolicibacterium sp. 120270]MDX1883044.1 hypothetical protein [Mycolicibacterium sp. 120270]